MKDLVLKSYAEQFGGAAMVVVRAPGRVNLIGEHTDYNGGFVLPMAIDRAVWMALSPRDDRMIDIYSINYGERSQFSLDHIERGDHGWVEYVKGVAWSLQEAGNALRGWNAVMWGDVPLGAGLSSSAALEMAVVSSFISVSDFTLSETEMALIGQRAENKWVGVNCGIMDQLISSSGKAGYALLIDCRFLSKKPVPIPPDTTVVILDTTTRRGLESSAYNERRAQCEAGAKLFGVSHLRDVTVEEFESRAGELDEMTRKRCRHVITENARTEQAAVALENGDAHLFGQLMNESHASLRDDFQVSCRELDVMAECAWKVPACLGARMTGAGFGGCAVALVQRDGAQQFVSTVEQQYRELTALQPNIYICEATDGAKVVE